MRQMKNKLKANIKTKLKNPLRRRTVFFACLATLFFSQQLLAQDVNQSHKQFRRNTALVIFSSLGGGVLGLSTLSFYGRPEEHTDNVTAGVAVGFIAGLAAVFMEDRHSGNYDVRSRSPWIPEASSTAELVRSKNALTHSKNFNLNWNFDI